jgi:hypothetical protein
MTSKQQIRMTQMIFAGAATVGALVLFGGFATDGDENFVNDNGQTSGDIFQQNAQDQN